jgi:peroxiredoxin
MSVILITASPCSSAPPAKQSPKKDKLPAKAPAKSEQPSSLKFPLNPTVYLLRDPAIHTELRLDNGAKQTFVELATELEGPFWRLRNASPDQNPQTEKLLELRTQLNEGLEKASTLPQRQRLQQIVLQLQGTAAFSQPEFLQELGVMEIQQRAPVAKLLEDYQTALKDLRVQAGAGKDLANLNRRARTLQEDLETNLQGTLRAFQRERLKRLRGKPFDHSKLQPLAAMAPELRDVETWVNGKPVALKDLRGRVVVVHFYTFGCINCIHNFPAYKNYQDKFKNRNVSIVGIHSPETPGEKVVETVRTKAEENGFQFPIAIDNDLKNWQAWANRVWPCVYVIDKRGLVRYWWEGELNWQGAGGEKYIAAKIEELLAEK